MIGLDTNVVVRYLSQDDPRQSAISTRLFERTLSPDQPGYIALVTLCEIVWVLEDCYGAGRARLRAVVEGLLGSRQIAIEESDLVWKALRAWEPSKADLSDCIIGQVLAARGCTRIVTFDKAAARLPGFELLA